MGKCEEVTREESNESLSSYPCFYDSTPLQYQEGGISMELIKFICPVCGRRYKTSYGGDLEEYGGKT